MKQTEKLLFLLFAIFLNGCDNTLEHQLKIKISRSSDNFVAIKDVKLNKIEDFYIGSRNDEDKKYYYLLKQVNGNYEICHVATRHEWKNDKIINTQISNGIDSLGNLGLTIESIYDDVDSVQLILVDIKNYFKHSVYSIKSIYSIDNLTTYNLDTCYVPECKENIVHPAVRSVQKRISSPSTRSVQ